MRVKHDFLFNFSASYSQGGYKRLYAFASWFNANGGASFAIHPNSTHLIDEFPQNRFCVVRRSHLHRLYDDWSYLEDISREMGQPELYYAYGIPLYRRLGRINWSHVQNVLIVRSHDVPLSTFHRLKLRFLARRFRHGFSNADVISAESRYSLRLLEDAGFGDGILSVNGSDDELASLRGAPVAHRENIATVVGTVSYKGLGDSLRVFQLLQRTNAGLKLAVIGDARYVPEDLRRHADVQLRGILQRRAVIDCLRHSRFFISTTHVENSYNCASEGAFLAEESFISDIPPHRELLAGESADQFSVPGLSRPMLHVRRSALKGLNLKSWDGVVADTIAMVRQAQPAATKALATDAVMGGTRAATQSHT